jgi:hypothetical protein
MSFLCLFVCLLFLSYRNYKTFIKKINKIKKNKKKSFFSLSHLRITQRATQYTTHNKAGLKIIFFFVLFSNHGIFLVSG